VALGQAPGDAPREAGGERAARLPLERGALRRGAAAYLLVAVPCAVVIATVPTHAVATSTGTKQQEPGIWVAATVVFVVVAPFVGGLVAARASTSARLRHATAAVALPGVAYLLIRIAVGLARGSLTATQLVSFALYLMVFTALAAAGGFVASWRAGRAGA